MAGAAGADLAVAGVRRGAAGVADGRRVDAGEAPEDPLGAPEATEAELHRLDPLRERRDERRAEHGMALGDLDRGVAAGQGVGRLGHRGSSRKEHRACIVAPTRPGVTVPRGCSVACECCYGLSVIGRCERHCTRAVLRRQHERLEQARLAPRDAVVQHRRPRAGRVGDGPPGREAAGRAPQLDAERALEDLPDVPRASDHARRRHRVRADLHAAADAQRDARVAAIQIDDEPRRRRASPCSRGT